MFRLNLEKDHEGNKYGGTGRHTVGVHFDTTNRAITYMDPMGLKASPSTENLMKKAMPGSTFKHTTEVQQTVEDILTDVHDCGFLTTNNLYLKSQDPNAPLRRAASLGKLRQESMDIVKKGI